MSEDDFIHAADKMVAAYMAGATMDDAGALVGKSREACRRALIRAGVPPRPRGRRTHTFDEAFFDAVDTEAKAYWLGFVAADGYVGQRAVVVELAQKDSDHVARFRDALGAGHKLATVRRGDVEQARVKVSSTKLMRRLHALGLGPAGDVSTRPWAHVPPGLLRHFWRGLVDGDGHITAGEHPAVGLCGTESDMEAFAEYVRAFTDTRAAVRREPDKWLFTVRFGSRHALAIVRELYTCVSVALPRKLARAVTIMESYRVG